MRTINEALDDPVRATSDHLIIAVLLLATCEALHGMQESYPVHMLGLMNMVNCRGGLRALGFEGCVEAFSEYSIIPIYPTSLLEVAYADWISLQSYGKMQI